MIMAIVTNETLNALRTTLRGEFRTAFQNASAASFYGKLSTLIQSSSKTNTYDWLSKFPQMREWVGKRVLKSMGEASYQITNKKYEATLGVERTDIEDDNLGLYRTIAQSMGQEAGEFLDREIAKLMKSGFAVLCYDGQNFFDKEHPVYPNADGTKEDDDSTTERVSNIYEKTAGENNEPWFLLSLNRPLKPFILQQRTQMEFESITDTKDESVFLEDKYMHGIRWRGNFGFGLWQQAVGSKSELTAEAFEGAYKMMQQFKRDGGDPMGIVPSTLVVSPSNQSAAEKILKAQFLDSGASNINYQKVELIVNPWLA